MRRAIFLFTLLTSLFAVAAEEARSVDIGRVVEAEILLSGELRHAAPKDERAPVLLRLIEAKKDGSGHRYRVAFTVLEAGEYDLAQFLLDSAQAPPSGKAKFAVKAISRLPADFHGQPLPPAESQIGFVAWYRPTLIAAGLLWLAGLLLIWVKLYRRRRVAAPLPAAPAVSPWKLLLTSLQSCCGPDDWRRLEMRFLALAASEHPGLALDQLFPRFRADPEAGPILAQLEAALHRPDGQAETLSLSRDLETLCRRKLQENIS